MGNKRKSRSRHADDNDQLNAAKRTKFNGTKNNPIGGSSILELDDNVLIEILQNVSLVDLGTVGFTCRRLRAVARTAFNTKHRNDYFNVDEDELSKYQPNGLSSIIRMLHCFGDLIINIRFALGLESLPDNLVVKDADAYVFKLLVKYCTAPIIKLEIDAEMRSYQYFSFRSLNLKQLQEFHVLHLQEFQYLRTNDCLLKCKQLKVLSICGIPSRIKDKFWKCDWPQLRSFKYEGFELSDKLLTDFFSRNQQLIEISLIDNTIRDISVFGEMPNLETLKISLFDMKDWPELRFQKLKHLTLSCSCLQNFREIFDFCSRLDVLESLELRPFGPEHVREEVVPEARSIRMQVSSSMDKTDWNVWRSQSVCDAPLEILSKLKTLQRLKIDRVISMTATQLIYLITELPELDELILWGHENDVCYERPTYLQICDICRKREQKLTIEIAMFDNWCGEWQYLTEICE